MPTLIAQLDAREVLDSRGYPTVSCTCYLTDGTTTTASVPSGASTGTHEAVELRDHNPRYYNGQGVQTAVANVKNILSPVVAGDDPTNQRALDQALIAADGTPNKSRLGANAILAASIAMARAGAAVKHIPLYQHIAQLINNDRVLEIPIPFFNILNGGAHAGMNLDFQEFIIVPQKTALPSFPEQLHAGATITHTLKQVLASHHFSTSVGDEGGFAPMLHTNKQAIELIKQSCQTAGYDFANVVKISFDFAANTFFKNKHFNIRDNPQPFTLSQYTEYLNRLTETFHPFSYEDPYPEDEWEWWQEFTKKHGHEVVIIGDDLLVTNKKRLQKAIQTKACNAILVKPNQIGSVTEAIDVVVQAKTAGFVTVASHRSGETDDAFIADFAVGCGTDYVKLGAPVRGERVAKYNRLWQVYTELQA